MLSIKISSRPKSGMLHAEELKKAAAQLNFVILVQFAKEVETPVVCIAKALITILFCAQDSQTFHSLQPRELAPIPRYYRLNNASPLTSRFVAINNFNHLQDFKRREEYIARCRLIGKQRAAKNIAKILKNIREGGPVTVTYQLGVKSGTY